MEYRASFLMMCVGQFLAVGIEFIGIWALFQRFGTLQGWTLPEIALLYGMANTAFAIADMFGRGFDMFSNMVRTGDFDRLLVRPLPTAFQLTAQELLLTRIGRMSCGIFALCWSFSLLHTIWDIAKILLLAGSLLGGACVFFGLFVLQATCSFWTVESLEVWNMVTYGGVEAAQFPMTIYRSWMRDLFTFIVPIACLNYIPASILLNHPQSTHLPPFVAWFSPLVGPLFLFACLRIWRIGEGKYCSTGS
jgi:ABC-2 type transport system permease protein